MVFKKVFLGVLLLLFLSTGTLNAQTGEYIQTISDFTRAIEANPRSVRAYVNRANLYNAKGQYELSYQRLYRGVEGTRRGTR